jgi:DNA-binding transcriptional LysR family regulator
MDLKKIRYFEAVAAESSFRRAADRLHVAHTALSKQVALLEEELGCELFIRSKQRVRLSPPGHVFLEHVRRILQEVDFAVRQVQRAANGHMGILRMGFRETAGRLPLVTKAFGLFRSKYPEVELHLEQLTVLAQCEALQKGELDIGLMYSPPAHYREFSRLTVAEERIFIAMPKTHRLVAHKKIRLKDLEEESFIGFKNFRQAHYAKALSARFMEGGLMPRIVQKVESEAAMMNLVSVGVGVSTALATGADMAPPGIVFRPIEEIRDVIKLELVWIDARLSPIARNFIEIMRQAVM